MKPYYLKIAIRNALRNGTLSFAKLFGLSISFSVILFAVGYAYFETSFDRCVPDHDRIYRCLMEGRLNGQDASFAVTSPEEAKALVTQVPEITDAVRIFKQGSAILKYNHQNYQAGNLYLADPGFFKFFGVSIKTNVLDPLAAKDNLIIARSLARTMFGSVEQALDKKLKINNEDCIITGVFDDLPGNFHIQTKIIQSLQKTNPDQVGWGSQSYFTYIKTAKPVKDIDALNFKISKIVLVHSDNTGLIDAVHAKSWKDLKYNDDLYVFYTVEPLSAIHFSSHKFDPAVTANKVYVYGAVILAFLILLISSINFVNLTLASISTRLKDIGIRKTTGARNYDVIRQLLFESFAFLFAGFVIALFIYKLAEIPLLNYVGFEVSLTNNRVLAIIGLVFVVLLLFNLAVFIAPLMIVSKKKILNLIREDTYRSRFSINNGLVFSQFVLSGLIILSAFIVQKQINFMVSKDCGYNGHNVMMLVMWEMNPETRKSFIEDLKRYDAIESVSTSDVYFGDDPSMNGAFFDRESEETYFHTSVLPVDDAFLKTFNLQMKEGRFFEKDNQQDYQSAILNETALNQFTEKGSVVGRNVILGGKTCHIIGVIKDFNFRSLYYPIQPLVMVCINNFGNVFIRIKNNRIPDAVQIIEKEWKKFSIPFSMTYKFHDEVIAARYIKDQQAKKLLLFLSIISIAIACVGLYAISYFRIVSRTKEIGIRKVNGAQIAQVMTLLNMDFLKWVVLAFVIACPVAWFVMHKWLQNFAYKTALSWWVFALAGAITVVVAMLTVSWQSWRAATRNPVEALRYE